MPRTIEVATLELMEAWLITESPVPGQCMSLLALEDPGFSKRKTGSSFFLLSYCCFSYVKASNTGASDRFGTSVSLMGSGNFLAVGAPYESSSATGFNGDQANNEVQDSGAVYTFIRSGSAWTQQA